MADKEKIIAEIERRYNQNNDKLTKIPEFCDEASILRRVCAEDLYFRDFINSLPAEPSEEKEINLVEILKHYPRETKLYSPLYGKIWLAEVDEENEIITCYKYHLDEGCTRAILEQEDIISFYSNGTTGLPDCSVSKDCMLFLYDTEDIIMEDKEKTKAEQLSEELEEAAKDFVERNSPYTDEFMLDNEVEEAYKIAELTFKRGTQWQKNQTINKACEWLQKHMNDYLVHGRDIDFIYDDFRKAMEKEDEQ